MTPNDAEPEIDMGLPAEEDGAKAAQVDPVEAAAEVMVRRALEAAPGLKGALPLLASLSSSRCPERDG